MQSNIRNFTIIAHVDHGKSTLADRLLEYTQTVEKRKMREQVLDQMDLERERGITIKMQPVRMRYQLPEKEREVIGTNFAVLNLIDTPGHIDFSYEVSRALKAVEGAVLLVDATQGVQAQTLSVLSMARELNLAIIPALSKVDMVSARIPEVKAELARLLDVSPETILEVSGKTGQGVPELLSAVMERIPPPRAEYPAGAGSRALVFDFEYSAHRGVIVYVRVVDGTIHTNDLLAFSVAGGRFSALEVGTFAPEKKIAGELSAGEIGYIVTGIKEARVASVGDTVINANVPLPAIIGYRSPAPVVWASVYPESQDVFDELRRALERLSLSDSSFSFEEESSGTLGRGFRIGFLGMLHLEIILERLKREFGLALVVTSPTITYKVTHLSGSEEIVYSPSRFPDHGAYQAVAEPWVSVTIITPVAHLGAILKLLYEHEAEVGASETFAGERVSLVADMPLRELMRNFFDELKSISSGFASLSYALGEFKPADVVRLDILVADEPVPAFAKVVSKRRVEKEARAAVERLKKIMPRQLFVVKVQGKALGRIVASETIPALRKDVTGYLYGGDVTRKKKLLEKQKKGKKRLKARGTVEIPEEVFVKMLRGSGQ
ncbi:MAG: elongation factor 4 [Candidatus Lloydbacteria bacterium CG22_combo_CG10-13_8_21_14_all_47_15]|uniref:Elongation factor 4 n=1 Tax=Candidatus Lloydbacteria bacterium CG22_combo_CG10-13_8_21_14_all_47_15 TaxID=1974635 RepID=A0A2H0CTS2_9BACT|nr:MAG: elongation factor 4 [Candidatus Lloydbacteria bacterium CG22_combo_CG10-13_8_21_14_all_47_15]